MFLSKWSVQRPIAMTAFIIVLVMIGISLYPKISIDLLPNMEIPTVLVRCEYEGASPTEIEVEIAKRIEDAVSSRMRPAFSWNSTWESTSTWRRPTSARP